VSPALEQQAAESAARLRTPSAPETDVLRPARAALRASELRTGACAAAGERGAASPGRAARHGQLDAQTDGQALWQQGNAGAPLLPPPTCSPPAAPPRTWQLPSAAGVVQVVMLGLDAAGKTTILYKLHIGEILSTVPTIGAPMRPARGPQLRSLAAPALLPLPARRQPSGAPSAQASTWRRCSTRTCSSRSGTWAARRSCGRCGATTSTTQTA